MNPKISKHWTPTERRLVIDKLERRLKKPITADDIETTLRKLEMLEDPDYPAVALEVDAEWLLQGLDVERVEAQKR